MARPQTSSALRSSSADAPAHGPGCEFGRFAPVYGASNLSLQPNVKTTRRSGSGRALNESAARVEKPDVVDDLGIAGVARVGLHEFGPRGLQVAPQHVRVAEVVKDLGGF